jgi:hypothetical protein
MGRRRGTGVSAVQGDGGMRMTSPFGVDCGCESLRNCPRGEPFIRIGTNWIGLRHGRASLRCDDVAGARTEQRLRPCASQRSSGTRGC